LTGIREHAIFKIKAVDPEEHTHRRGSDGKKDPGIRRHRAGFPSRGGGQQEKPGVARGMSSLYSCVGVEDELTLGRARVSPGKGRGHSTVKAEQQGREKKGRTM